MHFLGKTGCFHGIKVSKKAFQKYNSGVKVGLKNKKILITGGAGFIGAALGNKLSKDNTVIALDNLSSGDWNRCSDLIHKHTIDLVNSKVEDIQRYFESVDYVFHFSASKLNSENKNIELMLQNNMNASLKVFTASGLSGVQKVIFSSSLYSYGSYGPGPMEEKNISHPDTFYGLTKFFGEQLLSLEAHKYNFQFVNARLFFIYGPHQYADGGYKSVIIKNFENIKNGKPVTIYGSGEQALDYVYIDDCIESLIQLAGSDFSGLVNISSGKPITVLELIHKMNQLTDSKEIDFLPADWTDGTIRFGLNNKLKSIIGWAPATKIEFGLKKTFESLNVGRI
jgi:UDP-glucose 4-epimerase